MLFATCIVIYVVSNYLKLPAIPPPITDGWSPCGGGYEYKIARRLKDGTLKILKKSYKSYREAKKEANRKNKKYV